MTAVVGLLNKKGVAIAADSAVTRTRNFNQKVTKNGNKMVRLSNVVPISVMLTGNGDFMRTQWDIIIRHYREHRGDIKHDTVEACMHDFFRYIADHGLFVNSELVTKYLIRFLNDPSYGSLVDAFSAGGSKDREAFQAVHTLKGLSLNLGMTQLTKSAAALTEALRFGRKPEAEACFAQVKLDYNMTAEAIRRLAEAG